MQSFLAALPDFDLFSDLPPTISPLESLSVEPATLATVAAALRVCDHPDGRRLPLDAVLPSGREVSMHWCAHCGACANTPRGELPAAGDWVRTVLSTHLTKAHLADFEHHACSLHALTVALEFVEEHAARKGDLALSTVQELGAHRRALSELVSATRELGASPLVRSAERLGPAFAAMSAEAGPET